jgi:hypothetical protein
MPFQEGLHVARGLAAKVRLIESFEEVVAGHRSTPAKARNCPSTAPERKRAFESCIYTIIVNDLP